MSGELPPQELVDLIGSGHGKGPYVFFTVPEGELDERPDARFIETAEPAGQVAKAHDRVPPDTRVLAGAEPQADILRTDEIRGRERHRDRDKRKLPGIVPQEGVIDVSFRKAFEVLEPSGGGHVQEIIQHRAGRVKV